MLILCSVLEILHKLDGYDFSSAEIDYGTGNVTRAMHVLCFFGIQENYCINSFRFRNKKMMAIGQKRWNYDLEPVSRWQLST